MIHLTKGSVLSRYHEQREVRQNLLISTGCSRGSDQPNSDDIEAPEQGILRPLKDYRGTKRFI